jgi:hypothetical protein
VSECRYIPLAQRAEVLIEKGTRAWQAIQRLSMAEDDLVDSVVLVGQELWLPHHEYEAAKYSVTLRVAVHYPPGCGRQCEDRMTELFQELERRMTDETGSLWIAAETRTS